jgi:acyl-ACP thioesterase
MYTFNSRIRYSETDRDAYLMLESLIDYFQDCSTFHTQDGPADMKYLKDNNLAWVLASWQIEVLRYPKLCEEVTIGTIPYQIKGFMGLRNFFMDTAEGERLAVANSEWTLIDTERGIPRRITPEIQDAYTVEERLPMNYCNRKIAIPENAEVIPSEEIQVRRHHLDTNNHVNNGQYVRMAIDALPDSGIKVSSMRAEYKKQSRLGDVLYPEVFKVSKDSGIAYTICLRDENRKPVCNVELITQ